MKPVEQLNTIAIIGNGLMGQRISQVFARAGKNVTIIGRSNESLATAYGAIRTNFDTFVQRKLINHEEAESAVGQIACHHIRRLPIVHQSYGFLG
jgi:3-hydroxybutyryl-CoA dehydrogenase